ncbi:hypothetical protein C8J57DRAFT_1523407 [Mycena rebaudengoi]|nr:hypothetical protein C8J57DRAFT_1523407 [Mycena rebaudengoi]
MSSPPSSSPPGTPPSLSPDSRLTPPSNPVSPDARPMPLIPPLFIDSLAKEFGLAERELKRLRGLVQVVSCAGGSISQAELVGQLYTTAIVMSEAAERRRLAEEAGGVPDLKGLFNDLKIRLDDTFTLTRVQKVNVRCVCQDTIYEATRTVFSTMHIDVLASLERQKVVLQLDNIFGVPVRVKMLNAFVKTTSSSVRNAWRQDIRDSIEPTSYTPLETFVFQSATKYKNGGPGEQLSDLFTIHAALLRRFAYDNPMLLGKEEAEDENENENDEDLAVPSKKKRKRAGGRIPKGKDFWSQVDAYFNKEVESRGRNFTEPRWKEYVKQIIADDKQEFLGLAPGIPVASLVLGGPTVPVTPDNGGLAGMGAFTFAPLSQKSRRMSRAVMTVETSHTQKTVLPVEVHDLRGTRTLLAHVEYAAFVVQCPGPYRSFVLTGDS